MNAAGPSPSLKTTGPAPLSRRGDETFERGGIAGKIAHHHAALILRPRKGQPVAGRHDEAVATLLAASIDAAMKHELQIRVGNLAGAVQAEYPKLMAEIGKLPRGKSYLAYINGYAISRYRTKGGADVGRQLDTAFALLDNPAMPAKPLYLDEFGDHRRNEGSLS